MISGVCYKLALQLLTKPKKGIERKKEKNAYDGIAVAFSEQSRFSFLPSSVVQYPRADCVFCACLADHLFRKIFRSATTCDYT